MLLSLLVFVAAVGELVYFRRFALRIPDAGLAKSTRTLTWAWPISGAVYGLSLAAVALAGGVGAGGGLTAALGGVGCFLAVAMLVLVLWYVRLLGKYKNAFRDAARESRAAGGIAS